MIDPEKTRAFQDHLNSALQRSLCFWKCLRDSRKHQKVFRGTCGTPANTKKFSERLAGLPQTPKSFSRDLRESRKRQKGFRETCGTPANAEKFSETLAGLPQTPKSFPRHLRDSRKHFQKHFGRYSALSKTFFWDKEPHFLSPNPHFITWETNISIESNQDQSKYTSHKYPRVFSHELSHCRE